MSKRLLVKLGAITAAFVIAAVPVTTVFAVDLTESAEFGDGQVHNFDNINIISGESVSLEDDWSVGISVHNGTTVNVSGDVENETTFGIVADDAEDWGKIDNGGWWSSGESGDNATVVNIGGSVSNTGYAAIDASGNSLITVDGNVTLNSSLENSYGYAVDGTNHYNNLNIGSDPQYVDDTLREAKVGEITIGGDVISTKAGVQSAGFPVTVGGDVVADSYSAIKTHNGGTVKVGGNVTGKSGAIEVNRVDNDKYDYQNDLVIVEGTIKSTYGSAIVFIDKRMTKAGENDYRFPDIVVYQIDESNKDSIAKAHLSTYTPEEGRNKFTNLSDEECKKAADAIISAINYIIRTEGDIQLSGDSLRNYDGHDTMRYGETVTASVADGYTVEGSDAVTVTKVSDGVYNITLNSQLGGITLKAAVDNSNNGQQVNIDDPDQINSQQWQNIMSQIQSQQEAASNNNSQSDNTASSDLSVAATGSNGVAVATSDTATLTALSADGSAPAREVSFSMSELSTSQYQTAVVENINNTPSGETLRIETDTAACLDSAMLEAFSAKDIDLEVVFTYNGQKLLVVIPKGYDITKLLDEKGYCGFLRLASILGSTVV